METRSEEPTGKIVSNENPATASSIPAENTYRDPGFHIVGVGASAGGLEAIEKFFSSMPADSGMSFVVIQHLSPTHKSHMVGLLSKHTPMKVQSAEHNVKIEPNQIYLIPPSKNIQYQDGQLLLSAQDRRNIPNYPIDYFLDSIAREAGPKAIGVILSGTGSDGTRGLRAIKEHGGLAIVQDPDTAQFDGMPRSAINTVLVDQVIAPSQMSNVLVSYTNYPGLLDKHLARANSVESDYYANIMESIQRFAGVDFRLYKQSTVSRRIAHRMGLTQTQDLQEYAQMINSNPPEVKFLFRELLIGVTRFFRNEEAFEKIEKQVIPDMFQVAKTRVVPSIRCWVAGCSTGEEAYSLAMLLHEEQKRHKEKIDIKVFATDIDPASLSIASRGVYPGSIVADVSTERLQRYFVRQGEDFQIARELRQMIIFAPHNVTRDIPFSKVDLVTCRNLLIYLNPHTQTRVLINFAYALNKKGYLFLGRSEHTTDCDQYFTPVDLKHKLYINRGEPPKLAPELTFREKTRHSVELLRDLRGHASPEKVRSSYISEALATYMPPSVVVDQNRKVLYFFGDTNLFLKMPMGLADMDILKIVHPDIRILVGTALHKAFKTGESSVLKSLAISENEEETVFDLVVESITSNEAEHLAIILFKKVAERTGEEPVIKPFDIEEQTRQRIEDLERKLQYSDESLQAAIEELETSNEELQATNEELMASNEELQSTNEELQSTNEELSTVNSEFQQKIQELLEVTSDMESLMESTQICALFLDRHLQIRKFTEPVKKHFALTLGDIGRPIYHFTHQMKGLDLVKVVSDVIEHGEPVELNVQNKQGEWYLLRVNSYKVDEKEPHGAVVTFVDITDVRKTKQILQLNNTLEREITERILAQKTLEDLIYLTSHELKSPLRAFRFLAQNIEEHAGHAFNEQATADMQTMLARISRMESIVDSLLFYSRLGRFDEHATKKSMKDLLSGVLKKIPPHKGFEIKQHVDKNTIIDTNVDNLEKVLQILIENAIQHHDSEHGTIEISANNNGELTEFSVVDDGPGISEEDQARLFNFFHKDRPKAEEGSLGMGLAIVKKTIESRGGTLEVDSQPGEGSNFTFRWPNHTNNKSRKNQKKIIIKGETEQ